jgi:hypothetical protein
MQDDRPDQVSGVIGSPLFPLALRVYRTAMSEAFRCRPGLHRYVSGSRRFFLHSLAFHLHITRNLRDDTNGLTLKNLRAACAEGRVASPGMAHLYLQMLHARRMLVEVATSDRRFRRFEPTEKMINQVREQTRANLAPVDVLFPEIGALTSLNCDPEFLFAVRRAMGEVFFQQGNPIRRYRSVNYFADKASGHMLLLELMEAAAAGDPLPVSRTVKIDLEACAVRCAVSRMHISKVFAGAARLGLLSTFGPGGGAIRPSEALIGSYLEWAATQFLFFRSCALTGAAERAEAANSRRAARITPVGHAPLQLGRVERSAASSWRPRQAVSPRVSTS